MSDWQPIETAPKDGREILCTWVYELPDGPEALGQRDARPFMVAALLIAGRGCSTETSLNISRRMKSTRSRQSTTAIRPTGCPCLSLPMSSPLRYQQWCPQ